MGYGVRAGMIEGSRSLLESILIAVEAKEELLLTPRTGQTLSKLQYDLRRLLAACDEPTLGNSEAGGRYAGLGKAVRLVIDKQDNKLIVRPSGHFEQRIQPGLNPFGEQHAIRSLEAYTGEITPVIFLPSIAFNEAEFVAQADKIGWEILTRTRKELEEGRVTYLAERKQQKRNIFDIATRKV